MSFIDPPHKNPNGIADHNGHEAILLSQRYASINRTTIYPKMYQAFQNAADKGKVLRILDIGCGSGDDALLFAKMGHSVVGIDPSDLRSIAEEKNAHKNIIYIDDSLPDLNQLKGLGQFDAVNMSAVLQYIHPDDRVASFVRIATKMKQGAKLYLSYPTPPSRPHQYELALRDLFNTLQEANTLCRDQGFSPLLMEEVPTTIPDSKGRQSADGRPIVFHNVTLQRSLRYTVD